MANKKLIAARVQKYWTQEELAEFVGVTFVTISRWENGAQQPRPYAVRKLCQVFEASPEDLGLNIAQDVGEVEHPQERGELFQRNPQIALSVPYATRSEERRGG